MRIDHEDTHWHMVCPYCGKKHQDSDYESEGRWECACGRAFAFTLQSIPSYTTTKLEDLLRAELRTARVLLESASEEMTHIYQDHIDRYEAELAALEEG